MKTKQYIIFFFAILGLVSCEKNVIEYAAEPVTDMAEFQIHYFEPVTPSRNSLYMYQIKVNDKIVTNSTTPLNTYNAVPSGGVGLYFTVPPGNVNIKLYQSTDLNLVYDQNVNLVLGKQNVVIHDLQKPPLVFDTEYPFTKDRKSFYTDTIGWVKFYNFLYEAKGKPTTLTLQYQYQYILHPVYTEEDRDNGLIPEGKKLGDATGDPKRSEWFNLGGPVAFGQTTGWQEVPVKKSSFLSSGSAFIYYQILVTSGGVLNENMDSEGRLMAKTTATGNPMKTYNDYWTLYIGRRSHHFFSGARNEAPGSAVRTFWAQ